MTQLELANVALGHLGTISLADYNETSPEGVHVRRHWDLTRDALLRQRHWNFAIKRAKLDLVGQVDLTGVAITIGSTSMTVDDSTGVSVGDSILADFIPLGTTVTAVASTTLTLSGSALSTVSATTAKAYEATPFDYLFAYVLPSDYLRALEWNGAEAGTGQAEFDIEAGTLLSDDTENEFRYVASITDTTKWDSNFIEAFCLKLAARIAPGITTAQGLGAQLDQRAEMYLVKAFGPDNGETRPRAVLAQTNSGWLDARAGLDPRFT